MINVKIGESIEQNLNSHKIINIKSGDKIKVSIDDGASYDVLISDNEQDVILRVTNNDNSTYDVELNGLASLYNAGDIITQLLVTIDGEDTLVASMDDLYTLTTAAGEDTTSQNRSFDDYNDNLDPNRSGAEDGDNLRSGLDSNPLANTGVNNTPVVGDIFAAQNEIQGIETAGDLNIITGTVSVYDPDIGDTHTFSMVPGTLAVVDTNGVISLLDDSIEATLTPDGTYTISGDFNDLSVGEIATVTFNYTATDQDGLISLPATVSFTVTGTNDIPVVEAINEGTISESYNAIDTQEDVLTTFSSNLVTATDDDVNDTHTYHLVETSPSVTNELIVEYSVEVNLDGTYTITGDFNSLAAQENAIITFQYYANDGGGFDGTDGINESSISDFKTITLQITGTNDQPIVADVTDTVNETHDNDAYANGEDDTQDDVTTSFDGSIATVEDADVNDTHTYQMAEGTTYSLATPSNVEVTDLSVTVNENGTYNVNGNFNQLALGESATVTFQYTATDSSLGSEENNISEPKLVTLVIHGTNDQPVVADVTDSVIEIHDDNAYANGSDDTQDDVATSFDGSVATVTDDDVNDTHTYQIAEDTTYSLSTPTNVTVTDLSVTVNENGTYNVNGNFNALALGESATVTFLYTATDSSGASDESAVSEPKLVTLVIHGTNDQPIVEDISNTISESHDLTDVLGVDDTQEDVLTTFNASLATATDDDTNDTHTYEQYGDESINNPLITDYEVVVNEDGTYSVVGNFNALASGESATVTFQYTATDSSGATDESAVSEPKTVTLTVQGTNDQPVVQDINANGISEGFETGLFLSQDHDIESSGEGSIGYSQFTIHEVTTLTITTNGPTIDPVLYLLRNDGDLSSDDYITHNDDGWTPAGSWNNSIITITLQPGEYMAAVGDFGLSLSEVVAGINDPNSSGIVTLDFTANNAITLHNGNATTNVFYESHDSTDVLGEDDTQEDVTTTFSSSLATATDDDVNNTHTYDLVEDSEGIDNSLISEYGVVVNEDGTYSISGNFNALAAGETATVTFQYTATDSSVGSEENNTSEPKTVTLTVTGTNDQPIVSTVTDTVNETHDNDAYANGEDDTQEDVTTSFDGSISTVEDGDVNDTHTYQMAEGTTYSLSTPANVEVTDLNVTVNENGTYNVNGNFNQLALGESATVTFQYTATDSSLGSEENNTSEPKLVTITITGTNDQPIIESIETIDALETTLDMVTYGSDIDVLLSEVSESPQEGSGLKVVVDTAAGETVAFDWDFRSSDVFNDSAIVIVDGVVVGTVDTSSAVTAGTFSHTFDTAGEHTVTFVVVNDRLDDEDHSWSAELDVVINANSQGVILSTELFGEVSGDSTNGWNLAADTTAPITGLDSFMDLVPVSYENAHLSGELENFIDVSDDDINDGYSYVSFDDRIVDFTEDTSGSNPLITTPIRVSLDVDGNYDVVCSSFDKLGTGESVTITFAVQVRDDSGISDLGDTNNEASLSEPKMVTIVINGTNDSPVLESVTAVNAMEVDLTGLFNPHGHEIPEDSTLRGELSEVVTDEDVNDGYTFVEQGQSLFTPAFATVVDTHGVINTPTLVRVNADGTYGIFNPSFNNLGVDETVEVSFDVQVTDGTNDVNGESAISNIQTVTLTISGTNDQPVVINRSFGRQESFGDSETTINGRVVGFDEDTNDTITYDVVSMDSNTPVTQIAGANFVRVAGVAYDSDANGAFDQSVDIAVRLASGSEIDLADIDITGITMDGDRFILQGDFNAIPAGESLVVKFQYNGTDSSNSDGTNGYDETSISESKMVTITVVGTNDDAQINVGAGQDSGDVAEDMIFQTDGQVTITDLDAGEAQFSTTATSSNMTTYGTFVIDADGVWSYTLNNSAAQELNEGTIITEIYTIHSQDGTASQPILIRIHGNEDSSSIWVDSTVPDSDSGIVQEDVNTNSADMLVVAGSLSITDVDSGDAQFSTTVDSIGTTIGILTMNTDGTWSYEVDNNHSSVQALGMGESIVEQFEVASIDNLQGDTHIVTVTINGTSDNPVITVDNTDDDAIFIEMQGADTGANAVAITNTISLSDVDGDNISSATVTIDNLQSGDELVFSDMGMIIGSYDELTGVLTLTSLETNGSTLSAFEVALNSVLFNNTSDTPNTTTRAIEYIVTDVDGVVSNVATENVDLTVTNDIPDAQDDTNSVTEAGYGVLEATNLHGNVLSNDSDVDSSTIEVVGIASDNLATTDTSFNGNGNLWISGEYGNLGMDAQGQYWYNLKDDRSATDALEEGEIATEVFTYTITDTQGETTTANLTVTVTGTNDAPTVTALNGSGFESTISTLSTFSGQLDTAVDVDSSVHTYSQDGSVGVVSDAPVFGVLVNVNAMGTYSISGDFEMLSAGETAVVTFNYIATDDLGAPSTPETVTFTVSGTDDNPIASSIAFGVEESSLIVVDTDGSNPIAENAIFAGELPEPSNDINQVHTYGINPTAIVDTFDGPVGVIDASQTVVTILPSGEYSVINPTFNNLADGESVKVAFGYTLGDGGSQFDTATIIMTVTGTNDRPMVSDVTETAIESNGLEVIFTGDLDVSDIDTSDTHTFTISNENVTTSSTGVVTGLDIEVTDSATGAYTVTGNFDQLAVGETALVTFDYIATDSSIGSQENNDSEVKTVTITVTGTNDQPIAVSDTGAVHENLSVTVDVLANDTDLDNSASFTLDTVSSPKGIATIVGNQLVFEANAEDFDHLDVGATEDVTVTYTMSDENGATSTSSAVITVTGTNDQPIDHEVINTGAIVLDGTTTTIDSWNFTHNGGDLTIDMLTEVSNDSNPWLQDGSGIYTDINGDGIQTSLDVMIRVYEVNPNGTRGAEVGSNDDNNNPGNDGSVWNRDSFLSLDDLSSGEYQLVVGAWNLSQADVANGANSIDNANWHYEGPYQISLTSENGVQMGTNVSILESINGDTTFTGDLQAVIDVDTSDTTHDYSVVSGSQSIDNPLITNYSVSVDAVTGTYSLVGDFNALAQGDTATVTFDYVADDGHGFDGSGINESSLSEPVTVTILVTGTNDAPILTYTESVDNVNETQTGTLLGILSVSDVDGTVGIGGFSIGGDDASLVEIIDNGGVYELRLKTDANVDYEEPNLNLDVSVTYNDGIDNSNTQDVSVAVNDISGTVTVIPATTIVNHTFTGWDNQEGWTTNGEEANTWNTLDWFGDDSDSATNSFDLSSNAGESIDIDTTLMVHGGWPGYNGWEGNDTFNAIITNSSGEVIGQDSWSPQDPEYSNADFENGATIPVSLNVVIPDDGEVNVEFTSSNTDNWGANREYWNIDDFKITTEEQEVLTFDSNSEGEINLAVLLDQASNDFNTVNNPDSLDKIDITDGQHVLSNLTLEDFVAMTDDDNTLQVTGDSGDTFQLNNSEWSSAGVSEVADYNLYTATGAGGEALNLLIHDEVEVDII